MNVEHVDLFYGEDRTLTLHGRDANNIAVNLTGKTVDWYVGCPPLLRGSRTLLTKSGTVTVAATGTFTVALDAADTLDLEGDYEHMARATTTSTGDVAVILRGRFRVRPVVRAA